MIGKSNAKHDSQIKCSFGNKFTVTHQPQTKQRLLNHPQREYANQETVNKTMKKIYYNQSYQLMYENEGNTLFVDCHFCSQAFARSYIVRRRTNHVSSSADEIHIRKQLA